ncbi:MAG: pyruvate kinase [Planctomycetota bacterium]
MEPETLLAGAAEFPVRTKIVATVGPASESQEALHRLVDAGVNVFRLNFSHGTLDEHAERVRRIRAVAAERRTPLGILGDLQGPKIRIGKVSGDGIMLEAGQEVIIRRGVPEAFVADDGVAVFGTTFEAIIDAVDPGQRVLINDGAIRMLAIECERAAEAGELRCRVTVGGLVTSAKGINLPETDLKTETLSKKDLACVEFAVEHHFDFLALSFVRAAEEIRELKTLLRGMCSADASYDEREAGGATIPVVSKIERPQALENLESIVDASDAVMVARGDLGVEMDIARTPSAQKRIIETCKRWGKPCIVATQMLETMVESTMPTRAEASDVANAIFDRADAVMLSAETATGKHPDLVVETMRRIIRESERYLASKANRATPPDELQRLRDVEAAIAHGAWHVVQDLGAKLAVCWSQVGRMARYLSQNDIPAPIVAFSSSKLWARRMALLSNVTPVRNPPPETGRLSDWTDLVEEFLRERNWVSDGDIVVLLAGKPLGDPRAVNTIAVLRIGEATSGFRTHDS